MARSPEPESVSSEGVTGRVIRGHLRKVHLREDWQLAVTSRILALGARF